MASLKNQFINRFGNFVGGIPHTFLQKTSHQKLILPFYHSISDAEMPHIQHLYPVKEVKAFIQDLDFLLKHYTPIDYNEFAELQRNNKQPRKPSFLLSFDDGLSSFYETIAPILLQKGIPAICFLNSDFIDNKDLFYRYKSSLLIDILKKEPLLNKSLQNVFSNTRKNTHNLLSINYQNKDLLDDVASLLDYNFQDFLSNKSPYLTSNQINSLIKQGFFFGAHSTDHPEFQYLKLAEQIKQTKESIDLICSTYSIDYKIFSFPFTDYKVSKGFFDHIYKNKIADFTFGIAGQKKDIIKKNFQRIPLEYANHNAKQLLNSELIYYLLKIPFGKNTIYRNA